MTLAVPSKAASDTLLAGTIQVPCRASLLANTVLGVQQAGKTALRTATVSKAPQVRCDACEIRASLLGRQRSFPC